MGSNNYTSDKKKNTPHSGKIKNEKPPASKIPARPGIEMKAGLIVTALACILYINTLQNEYALDDLPVIFGNKLTTQGVSGIPALMKTSYWYGFTGIMKGNGVADNMYRPLSLISFAIDWQIAPNNPHYAHGINILLYALTGFLLFVFLARLLRNSNVIIPFAAALLFIAHPIHTEVVANIKSRDEILSLLFFLLAGLALLKSLENKSWIYLTATAVCYFLSLLCKETAFTFLLLFPMLLYFFRDINRKKLLITTSIFIGVVAIQFLIREIVLTSIAINKETDVNDNTFVLATDFSSRVGTAFFILTNYAKLLLFPHPLSCDYSFSQVPIVGITNPLALIGLLFYIGIFAVAAFLFSKKHLLSFAILFFLIPLIPFSNLLFLTGSTMAERLLYIPSVGFCIGVIWILTSLLKISATSEKYSGLSDMVSKNGRILLALAIPLLLFSFKTIERNKDWKNNYTLYSHDIKVSPNSAHLHRLYAKEMFQAVQQGRVEDSKRNEYLDRSRNEWQEALRINPDYFSATFELAEYYEFINLDSTAYIYYQKALDIEPGNQTVLNNLASNLIKQEYYDKAIPILKKLISSNPKDPKAYNNLGIVYYKSNRLAEAIELYKQVIALDPYYFGALDNMGSCYGMMKEYDKAIECFQKAIDHEPNNPSHYKNIGIVFLMKGDSATAQTYFAKADDLNFRGNRK